MGPWRLLGVVCLGLLAGGCGQDRPSGPACEGRRQAAIVGGSPEPSQLGLEEVAGDVGFLLVEARLSTGEILRRQCTVTRIAPGLALSAGHCVRGEFAELELKVGFSARVDDACDTELALATEWSTREPDLLLVSYPDAAAGTGISPMFSALQVGEPVILSGYGQTEEGGNGERRFIAARVADTTAPYLVTQAEAGGACVGDSGGPLLWKSETGRVFVAGVLSTGSISCRGKDNYVPLGPAREWVESSGGLGR